MAFASGEAVGAKAGRGRSSVDQEADAMIFSLGLILLVAGYGVHWLAKPRDIATAIQYLRGEAPAYVNWMLVGGFWSMVLGVVLMVVSSVIALWRVLP